VGQNNPKVPRPPRELKGFARVSLKPGEQKTVSLPLEIASFSYWDQQRTAWVADAGEYTLYVGDSSRNLPLKAPYALAREVVTSERP
jgi:beta-glucosidase